MVSKVGAQGTIGPRVGQVHAQALKQARQASSAFSQGFREHESGAYEGT